MDYELAKTDIRREDADREHQEIMSSFYETEMEESKEETPGGDLEGQKLFKEGPTTELKKLDNLNENAKKKLWESIVSQAEGEGDGGSSSGDEHV